MDQAPKPDSSQSSASAAETGRTEDGQKQQETGWTKRMKSLKENKDFQNEVERV